MDGSQKVLLAGLDKAFLEKIVAAVKRLGFETRIASTDEEASRLFWDWQPDLIVLDLSQSSKEFNGWNLLPRFSSFSPAPKIAIVSPESNARERILALKLGADDSVSRRASVRQIVARIKAIFRAGKTFNEPEYYSDGSLLVNFSTGEVFLNGRPIRLTPKEFAVLEPLARNPKRIMTSKQIARQAWTDPVEQENESLVRHYIYRLRRKLEPDPSYPIRIKNVRGLGYYLDDPRQPLLLT